MAAQNAHSSAHLFFFVFFLCPASYRLVRLFFWIRKEKQELIDYSLRPGCAGIINPRRQFWFLVDRTFTCFVFYLLMENEYIISPSHTIPETKRKTGGRSFVCSWQKAMFKDYICFSNIEKTQRKKRLKSWHAGS